MNPRKLFERFWNSPTFTSWGSIGVRLASITLILPLVLSRFETAEIAVWYLFSTIIGMQLYLEVGFVPTFQRMYSYALGGARIQELATAGLNTNQRQSRAVDWETVEAIASTTSTIFFRVGIGSVLLFATIGTASLIKPISECSNTSIVWFSWCALAITSPILIYGQSYGCYITGTNHIAPQQRLITLFGILATISNLCVLLAGGNILHLVISQQGWSIVGVFGQRFLARSILDQRFASFKMAGLQHDVFKASWAAAWKSGLGQTLNKGLFAATSLILAQIADTAMVASYLLGTKLIETTAQFSLVPFYSKLPMLVKARAEGRIADLTRLSQRGMVISYVTFLLGFFVIGIGLERLLDFIGSNVKMPTIGFWIFLGIAFFLQRFSSMHIQLYSTTNDIIWHKANFGYGVIYVAILLLCFRTISIYAIPLAMSLGYLFFHIPYTLIHSYRSIESHFLKFEKAAFIPASIAFVFFCSIILGVEFLKTK